MYHIAVCDDSKADRETLRHLLFKHDHFPDNTEIHEFASGGELLSAMERIKFAVVFLDIQMEGMDGNETAIEVRKRDNKLILVFITAYVDPTPVNFIVQPYRYLKKQMPERELNDYVRQILTKMVADAAIPAVTASTGKRIIMLYPGDIIYIEKFKRRCRIHITPLAMEHYGVGDNDIIVTEAKLKNLYEILKNYGFGFPHDSYIINFKYTTWITKSNFELKDVNFRFSISRSKAPEFNEQKLHFLVSKYSGEVSHYA